MEGTGEIGAVPTPSLWPLSAKMARNGAAESDHCQIKRGHAVRAVSHRFVFARLCRGN